MEPRRGNVTCAACEDTIPCVNNYLTFGAYDDEVPPMTQITRIALTQIFPIATPLTIQLSLIMNLVSFNLSIQDRQLLLLSFIRRF